MGNRQGSKMGARQEFPEQQRIRKHSGKIPEDLDVDSPTSEYYPDLFRTVDVRSAARGSSYSGLHRPVGSGSLLSRDRHPDAVSSIILQEELYFRSCLPEDSLSAGSRNPVTKDGSSRKSSHTAYSPKRLHSPSTMRRILQPSNSQNHPCGSKDEFTSDLFSDLSSSPSFRKRCCLESDVAAKLSDVENTSTSANNTITCCIDRLENLKRNIEHRNTENLTHFNNTGFAQLQSGRGYDDYDNADHSAHPAAWPHRRSKSMSPKTAVALIQLDLADKSHAVRKMSEPGQAVKRKDSASSKAVIPEAWSKSAENSPIIVRRALPNPGTPVMVQRTPSQSPSVERRFPANAPAASVLSVNGVESPDSTHSKSQAQHKTLFKTPGGCPEARETSLSVREKATAEISLPHVYHSPVSVRKMPESPVLRSTAFPHQEKSAGAEVSKKLAVSGDRFIPASLPLEPSVVHYMRMLSSSSCSSSSSESPHHKLPLKDDNVPSSILPCTVPTSFPPALGTSSPTPIQFCPQPKGTPIKTCTMVSQPSTAVIIPSRERQENSHPMDVNVKPKDDPQTVGKKTGPKTTDGYENLAACPGNPSSSAVTEDTIKENSQTAVFGSVSPKLLRHRRLLKDHSLPDSHSDSQHTFPKQSHSVKITTVKTSCQKGETFIAGFADDEGLCPLSQSAPSSFSSHETNRGNAGVASKTLGQRIRDVIFESNVGPNSNTEPPSMLSGKFRGQYSKDDILNRTIICEKSSYSLTKYSGKTERFGCDKHSTLPSPHERSIGEKRHEPKSDPQKPYHLNSAAIKDAVAAPDTSFHKSAGYSDHLKSSRDSCSSCVSDSSQTEPYGNTCPHRHVAELTQANLHHQTELLSAGSLSKPGSVSATRLGVPGQRLVTSDTSDTLSTDRDTSGSSKRESSTSTATDDTLTSFQTRSTADSADYDEFVLPASLVFVRSADRDQQHDLCGFESEQTTIKRKLNQRHLPGFCAEQEPVSHKTRKKRRKQLHVQSHVVTAVHDLSDSSTLKRNRGRAISNVYSDDRSDDSDTFGSKDDISDLPSSRDDMSDLPSSRDDISDLPSSRDDISDLPGCKTDTLRGKTNTSGALKTMTTTFSDSGASNTYVFHRSDLRLPESSFQNSPGTSRSRKRNLTADDHTFAKLANTFVNRDCAKRRSSSHDSSDRYVNVSGDLKASGGVLESGNQSCTFEKRFEDPHSNVAPALSSMKHPSQPLPASSPSGRISVKKPEDRYTCQHLAKPGLYSSLSAEDEEEDEGKKRLPDHPESENPVVFSCTIYNSACRRRGAQE